MKIITVPLLLSTLLYGQAPSQAPAPVNVAPGMPVIKAPGETTTAAPPVAPDAVVAEVNGKKYTAAELDKIIAMLPPQYQQVARSQPQMLGQVFLMQKLAADAEKAGLDQKAPYKDQLAMQRMQLLSTAQLSDINNAMQITMEDEEKYYKDNPDKYKEVKVRVIYVAFTPPNAKPAEGAKKLPTEAEAQAKIEDLAKRIKAGEDFGMLARANSDDKASAEKDGDYGTIKQDSAYPQPIKTAVFALKQGEMSAPIKQPNGFYLIRAEEISMMPFTSALLQISQAVKQAKFQEWLKGMQAQYNLKIENPAYFNPRVPAQLQQAH